MPLAQWARWRWHWGCCCQPMTCGQQMLAEPDVSDPLPPRDQAGHCAGLFHGASMPCACFSLIVSRPCFHRVRFTVLTLTPNMVASSAFEYFPVAHLVARRFA